MRTSFPQENGESGAGRTVSAQKTAETEGKVKFPKVVENRKAKVQVVIYPKIKGGDRKKDGSLTKPYPFYRVVWRVAGKRVMQSCATYSAALEVAEEKLEDLAKGSQVSALTPGQARDCLAGYERLQRLFVDTGKRYSILAAVCEFAESVGKLPEGQTLNGAMDTYRDNLAVVTRHDVAKAVEDFIASQEPLTKASEGKRAQLSSKYSYNRAIMLRRFAASVPNTALCELGKVHLDAFMHALGKVKSKSRNGKRATSAKSRNHHRAAIRQLLSWAVRKDYLAANHRLNEADAMRPENGNTAEVLFYTPDEFAALLDRASRPPTPAKPDADAQPDFRPLLPLVAIGGLAGLRTAELLRLTWEDTRRVDGHIEITSGKAKTRQRRLVEIVPALAQWLALPEFHRRTGRIWPLHEITFQQNLGRLCDNAEVTRKVNGLRHSFCSYGYALHGEVWTAQQAGHDPRMLFTHYRGLCRKAEAEKWFGLHPEQAANVVQLAQ